MKRFLPAVIGLSMAISASANGEMKDGWLIVEDFESNPAVTTYEFNPSSGNVATGTTSIVADPSETSTGKVLQVAGQSWQEIVELTVTLPAGKTIADFEQIAFDYYSSSQTFKNIKVMADDAEVYYSSNYGNATSSKKWLEFSTKIPEDITSGNTVLIRFGVDCSTNEGEEFFYDNLRLLPKATNVGTTKNGTVEGDTFYVEDFEASTPGSVLSAKGNTKATIVENIDGSGFVAKVANAGWEALPQFAIKMPAGKKLANIKEVKFDMYTPTDLDTQPSDPTFKMRQIAINGTQVYKDVDENGDDTYPNSQSGDKWATVTLEFNKLNKVTDAMKELTEFDLAVGINDNKITFYMDNVRFTLQDVAEPTPVEPDPIDPDKVYPFTDYKNYIYSFTPRTGRTVNVIKAGKFQFSRQFSYTSAIELLNPDAKASVYKDGQLLWTLPISLDGGTIKFPMENDYKVAGNYEIIIPANTIKVTHKEEGDVIIPAVKSDWIMVNLPKAGTEDDPLSINDIIKIADKANENMELLPESGTKLWYQGYIVGWYDKQGEVHFTLDDCTEANFRGTLMATKLTETNPKKCLWCPNPLGAKLWDGGTAQKDRNGRETFHKFYKTHSSYIRFETEQVTKQTILYGSIGFESNKIEITNPPVAEEIPLSDYEYYKTAQPQQGGLTNGFGGLTTTITFTGIKYGKIAFDAAAQVMIYCDEEEVELTKKFTSSGNKLTIEFNQKKYYEPGEYKILFPEGTLTFTLDDGSEVENPEMYYSFTVEKPNPYDGTETAPFERIKPFIDKAIASDYKFRYANPYELSGDYIWFKAYVVGWIENKTLKAHFDDKADSNCFATLLADSKDETDPNNCLWATSMSKLNLSTVTGKSAFNKYYLIKSNYVYSETDSSTGINYVKCSIGGYSDAKYTGIDSIDMDNENATVTVYNLQGMQILVNSDRDALSTLPAGLYIVNGKKMVIR